MSPPERIVSLPRARSSRRLNLSLSRLVFEADFHAEHFEKLADPVGMRGPGRSGDEIAVGDRAIDRNVGIGAAGMFHIETAGRIGRTGPALQHIGGSEQLRAMADRGDRLIRLEEVLNDFDDIGIEPQIFRCRPPGMTRPS